MTIHTAAFAAELAGHSLDSDDQKVSQPNPSPEDDGLADARLYLRHVEQGETIRALARELGCHASTVLRRIRRYEARREDPLVDGALDRKANALTAAQARRVLRRLAESGAQLAVAADMDKAIVTRDNIRTATLDRAQAEDMALRGWIEAMSSGRVSRYRLTPAGRAALRRLIAHRGAALPEMADFSQAEPVTDGGAQAEASFDPPPAFADRQRVFARREITDPETRKRRRARVNLAESPMLVLARRRLPDGQPFLSPEMLAAGERLREDFELAQLGPRVAQNWDRFLTAGASSGYSAHGFGGGSESARDRVGAALRDLGPGMGDLVLRVCCYLDGVEATEQRLGWSARSGKIVLRLALQRLALHYATTYGAGRPMIG